jgi:hypothetical protein
MSGVIDEELLLDDNQDYALEAQARCATLTKDQADTETWRKACLKTKAGRIFKVCNRRPANWTVMPGISSCKRTF